MRFWALLFANTIIPIILIITGYLMYKYPPKEKNIVIGYRTKSSMRTQYTWDFAQVLCGKLWLRLGAVILPISLIVTMLFTHANEDVLEKLVMAVEIVQGVLLLSTIFIVEKALKDNFDRLGFRKKTEE